jgi:hypothetical protein
MFFIARPGAMDWEIATLRLCLRTDSSGDGTTAKGPPPYPVPERVWRALPMDGMGVRMP